jgi:cysteine desulfuration protein SufE
MSPADRQEQLALELLRIEDPQERLACVQDRAKRPAPLPPENRTDAFRIQGCVTRVWLVPSFENGRCIYSVDSESLMVRGLALLLAGVYSGCTPEEILAFETNILEVLKLGHRISPTRLHGLARLRLSMQQFAAKYLQSAPTAACPAPPEP